MCVGETERGEKVHIHMCIFLGLFGVVYIVYMYMCLGLTT